MPAATSTAVVAQLILTAIAEGLPALRKVLAGFRQTGELTAEQQAELDARAVVIFASREAKTDDQIPASQGGTGPG